MSGRLCSYQDVCVCRFCSQAHASTVFLGPLQVGWVAATKYVNQASHMPPAAASLARIEKMDFLKPMRIGEVSVLEAEV